MDQGQPDYIWLDPDAKARFYAPQASYPSDYMGENQPLIDTINDWLDQNKTKENEDSFTELIPTLEEQQESYRKLLELLKECYK